MTLHGAGCCLIDTLYGKVDFSAPAFKSALSERQGDGGLSPGKLVFAEDFERFRGVPYEKALEELTGGEKPDARNLGGPSIVALAHAAQMLEDGTEDGQSHRVRYFGSRGDDDTGRLVEEFIRRLPLQESHIQVVDGLTPRTDVLSDPNYDGGHGERSFINLIGVAGDARQTMLPDSFFDADILAFGGTALVPPLHDELSALLKRGKAAGCGTVVNLVYDFRAEQEGGRRKWRLGAEDDAYQHIDLLVADREEALRTSGMARTEEALDYFIAQGVGAVVITEGARNVYLGSVGGLFAPLERRSIPVARAIDDDLRAHPERRGDTAGCGDNFVGGLLASTLSQASSAPRGRMDLMEACAWAVASGGFACFTVGGTYYEGSAGEKRRKVIPYVERYRRQLEMDEKGGTAS